MSKTFNRTACTCFLFLLIMTVLAGSASAARYEYWINNPFLRKIPIAIKDFEPKTVNEEPRQAAVQAKEWLVSGLEFVRYFQILPEESYIIGDGEGLTAQTINFANWVSIGADHLVTGGLDLRDGVLVLELRLFDVPRNRLIVGKRYKGRVEDMRKMIRRFCVEIVTELTDSRGVFGTKIAFVSNGPGNKEIFACEYDGFDPQQLTSGSKIALSPAWSGDGTHMAYVSYADGPPEIFIRNLAQKRGVKVAYKGINVTPAWDPTRFALAATLSLNGDQEIYSLTGNGKIIKKLTNNWGIDVSPSYSPDGKRMAFVSNRGGSPQIYIMELDTGQTSRVTFDGKYNSAPAFSPRGDRIAYCGMVDGTFDVFTVRTDGTDLQRLTDHPGDDEEPSWSPDGTLIAFSTTREGKAKIYVMTSHGTDQRKLLELEGAQTQPAWSPWLGDY
ncbi:WD40 domain protein beta Propeller [Desulfatibacillum aliphaticivorans]|uniref:WD40 domain protein beta Propeller n=1 Tax=Desulfatibacillum aliphaticivorans TaxID=218208 RepID=B8FBT3_DESAL|nr:Tol-Pal system beta propeller repeat protein TolB [Desulfatibacillum aliphaticivorans]ACL04836.1 WD40 domain protein beta Propeller [Desulfatibacillum aliphaticivorans]